MRPVVCRSPGDDSVELVRISLRFHQSLAASVGAAHKIAERRIASVKRSNDRLRLDARLVHGTVSKIDQLLGMADGPVRAGPAFMTIVSGSRGIAAAERIDHVPIRNVAGPSAVAVLNILSIPAGRREPHGKCDLGIFRRANHTFHFAMRGHREGLRIGKWSGGNQCRSRDGRMCQFQAAQAFT